MTQSLNTSVNDNPLNAVGSMTTETDPIIHHQRGGGPVQIQVEDDRTGISVETLHRAFLDHLFYLIGKSQDTATAADYYESLAYTVRDRLLKRWVKTQQVYTQGKDKVVCYLSAEFLMGRYMGNNLINLGLYESVRQAVEASGLDLDDLLECEPDPGLGNGGLGRLAACFLDSLATLEIPAIGYGIRYEFGIFQQMIRDGWQVEVPDQWLKFGNPWEIMRPEDQVVIKLGGHTESHRNDRGELQVSWIPGRTVVAVPYDTPVPGYRTNTVNSLRLWKAEASDEFNFDAFNAGNYDRAVADKLVSENISKVLYPNDNTPQGRELRLEQQYFFVSASLQDMIRNHLRVDSSLSNFHEHFAIQLNDTHPTVGVAELMRLLVDEHGIDWDQAWNITQKTFAYTNHTLMPEALERWPVSLFEKVLPRPLEIIYEINARFLKDLSHWYPDDQDLPKRLSIIQEDGDRSIRMAHLACIGSHAINGVAALHTELLKQSTLKDFYALWPDKFFNKTNGVTPRRWLLLSNPELSKLYTEKLGDENWLRDLDQLRKLEPLVEDAAFRDRWRAIKHHNKERLAQHISATMGIDVDPASMFDVQVKRIHEYKRQLLAVLHVITLYNRLKENPNQEIVPRTFIFSGKAAPGYFMAKLQIKLVNAVAALVNSDPDVRGRLKVVFLPNFSVSQGHKIYPAADLSEQISTAGKEASGTGNMKFAMSGSLTIGTLDGANIEIREEVGEDNFFLFGLTAQAVEETKRSGYNPRAYYEANPKLKQVLDQIASGLFATDEPHLFQPLVDSLLHRDEYMLLADYQGYIEMQDQVGTAYQDVEHWTRMSILNALRTAKFSSDRTIQEYCDQIWGVKPVSIEADTFGQALSVMAQRVPIPNL
ncbi:MAG: glycogen/starch/alpha-glucan phosphorylase [Synechococcales cyanobacterium CRU_2_2]|nr:glycogen/starch/alpha-glucan phosphorylase [Synechococcales cyanobacterium CRU_2_2]